VKRRRSGDTCGHLFRTPQKKTGRRGDSLARTLIYMCLAHAVYLRGRTISRRYEWERTEYGCCYHPRGLRFRVFSPILTQLRVSGLLEILGKVTINSARVLVDGFGVIDGTGLGAAAGESGRGAQCD
jgi:hypothetical protein